jgi:hypothetical protein
MHTGGGPCIVAAQPPSSIAVTPAAAGAHVAIAIAFKR